MYDCMHAKNCIITGTISLDVNLAPVLPVSSRYSYNPAPVD